MFKTNLFRKSEKRHLIYSKLIFLLIGILFIFGSCRSQPDSVSQNLPDSSLINHRQAKPDFFDIKSEIAQLADTSYFHRFQYEINRFKAADKLNFPDSNQILFIGSSSIRKWKSIEHDFQPIPVINRGFGGSTIAEVIYFSDDIIFPYKPKAVFLYAGENDLTDDRLSASDLVKILDVYVRMMNFYLPDTKLYFISLKPSPARKKYQQKFNEANKLIQEYCKSGANKPVFIDISEAMKDDSGTVRRDIFIKDNLHMNAEGYKIWTEILTPYLRKL